MHRARVLALMTAAACGRVDFGDVGSPGSDGAIVSSDGPAVQYATPSIVETDLDFETASSLTVSITATAANDTIAVAVAGYFGVTSISDDAGDTYILAMKQGDANDDTAEIWYAKAGQGGATAVTVNLPGANNSVVWVFVLANIDPDAPLAAAMGSTATVAGPLATAPSLTTTIDSTVVIGVGAGGGVFESLRPGDGFTELELQFGDAAAYDIAAQPGSYAATWFVSGVGEWSISAAAFAPARL